MNRTGLFALIAALVALGAGAYWYFGSQSARMEPQPAAVDTMASTSPDQSKAVPQADDKSAPAEAAAPAAPPADGSAPPAEPLGGAIAPAPDTADQTTAPADEERQATPDALKERQRARADRKAETEQSAEAKDAGRTSGYTASAPPPPPPPPPAPVASAPPPMAAPAPEPMPAAPPSRMVTAPAKQEKIPTFPWPVPKASASYDVPRKLIIGNSSAPTFGSVAERIASALDHAGYGERSYYALANGHGIAIATQLEQINDDGTPVLGQARFEEMLHPPAEQFSLTSYVKALFSARTGRFRIIVFTLSGPVFQNTKPPTEDIAMSWPANGQTRLPQRYALIPFTNEITCTALIYEFEKTNYNANAAFIDQPRINAMAHLMQAGIWTLLGKP